MHASIPKEKIILNHNLYQMKFKLIKDKEFFQIVCDQKSVKEITDGENKAYEIEWYASTKDKDRMNDIVEPTAFEDTLKQYMTNPIVLLQHDMDKPIGTVTEASIDEKGLFIKAKITEDTDGVFSKLKNGVLRTFSIGYSVKDYETIENVDAEWNYNYTNLIKALELFEISLVSVPANPFALVKSFDSCFKAEEEIETKEDEEPREEEKEENLENNNEEWEKPAEENNEEKTDGEDGIIDNKEEVEEEVEEEAKEESEEETKDVEVEKCEEWEEKEPEKCEEIPNEEVETQETCEEEAEKEEEVKEADENSEITTESEGDNSENGVESTPNDEAVDETSNEEVVEESKSIDVEHKSLENAEFKTFVDSFNKKLSEKDAEIKALKTDIANQNELIKGAIEVMLQLDHAIKNTAIQSWSSYQAPATKTSWYGKVAELMKRMQQSH